MPVKWVLHWVPNSGVTVNSQILSEISQSVESLNGVKGARWKAVLTFYKPILRVQTDQSFTGEFPRDFMGLSFSDQPDKYYFIIRGQRLVIEADSTIQTIMEKLQSYKQRVSLNFETMEFTSFMFHLQLSNAGKFVDKGDLPIAGVDQDEGTQYLLGDFQVRVEKVTPNQSESMRGIVMEVEYLPTSSLDKSRQILEEFVEALQEAVSKKTLPGHFMHCEPNFTEYGLPEQYGMQHTTVQYATVMAQLIATVQSAQAIRN